MIIDIHTHYAPTTIWGELERLGAFDELRTFKGLSVRARNMAAAREGEGIAAWEAKRLEAMDEAGVDIQVLSPGAHQPYMKDADRTRAAAAVFNDAYADVITRYPGRFAAFACLPLPYMEETLEEIDRRLATPGFVGVAIGCAPRGVTLDDASFEPLWNELNRRRTPVYIHPASNPPVLAGIDEYHLIPDFGSPAEIAVCAARLVVTGVTARNPDVPIILATLGGALPYRCHAFDAGLRQDNPVEHEAIGDVVGAFAKLYYDTSTIEEPIGLLAARDAFGTSQLMMGSDGPRIPPRQAIEYITSSQYLSEEDKVGVLGENAGRLLGLGALIS